MMNAAHWYSLWLAECKRIVSLTGSVWLFGNWRGLPTYMRALVLARMPATSCVVWDKDWIGPAYKNALRPTYEIVVMSAAEQCVIEDRCASDLMRCQWMAGNSKTTEHPAEKPIELLSRIIGLATKERETVLDCFAGSGSTMVAAKQNNRRAVGIEIEERYCEIAANRLAQGVLQFEDAALNVVD
jgi:site-specific DNA-methyltransferase (adenine-specific)